MGKQPNQIPLGISGLVTTAKQRVELAARKAYSLVYQSLIGQASTLAYLDTYGLLAAGAAIMFLLSFTLKKNEPGGGGDGIVTTDEHR